MPEQIKGTADVLYVFLPWGTLLQNIVKPTNESSQRFASVLKKPATMEILLGYDPKSEPSESTRLELPELTKNYLLDEPIKIFELNGFKLVSLEQIDKKQLDLWMRGYDLEISGTAQSGVGGRGAGTVGDQRDSFGSTIPRGIVVLKFQDNLVGIGKSNTEKIFNYVPKERKLKTPLPKTESNL